MIRSFAEKISFFYIKKGYIKSSDKEIYDYCFEILVSTVINFVTVIVIAILCNMFVETIFFLVGFMTIRATAGGYHARNHFNCWLILILAYIVYVVLLSFEVFANVNHFIVIVNIISFVIVEVISPVEDENKPFTKVEYEILKKKSRFLVGFIFLLAIVLNYKFNRANYAVSLTLGMFVVCVSLVAGKVKNRLIEKNR